MDFDKAYDKLDWVRGQLESTVLNSRVELMPSDMGDFFITVTQRNGTTGNDNTWSFCVNIDDNYVQMLEPTEDEKQFTNITEVFSIIKSFLNGGSSREKRFGNKIGSSRKSIKSSLSDVNKALGFTDKDIEEDGKIHITTDFGEFVVDYINDEYIVSYDGEERIFTEYKDTVEEVVDLFNQLCNEEVEFFNKNINSSKPIKSSAEPTKYDYHFFYNKLKDSPYFEEYVVRYDDDAGEDNIHTKQNIPVTIIFPDGKKTECPSCYVQFYQSGWRFVAEGVMSGKESYSEVKDVTFTSENVIIMDSDGFTFDFLYDNIAIKSSRKPIKSSYDRETLEKVIRAYLDKMGYKDVEGGVDAAADYIWQNEEQYPDYDLHLKVKKWFKDTKENYPETLIKASKTIKSDYTPDYSSRIFKGARFKNLTTGAICEIVRVEPENNYVLYKFNDKFPEDTTIDGIIALLKHNDYYPIASNTPGKVIREEEDDAGYTVQLVELDDGRYKVYDNNNTEDICDTYDEAVKMFYTYLG